MRAAGRKARRIFFKEFKIFWFVSLSTSCSSLTRCRDRDLLTSFIWPRSTTSGLPCNHRSRQISCCYNWQWITWSKLKAGLCGKIGFLCRSCDKKHFTPEVTRKDFIVSFFCVGFLGKTFADVSLETTYVFCLHRCGSKSPFTYCQSLKQSIHFSDSSGWDKWNHSTL